MGILKRLKSVDEAIFRVERILVVCGLLLMVLLIFGQIIIRMISGGFPWADELASFLMLWVSILGASLATRKRRHITIDALTKSLTPRGKAMTSLLSESIAVLFCVLMAWVGIVYVNGSRGEAGAGVSRALKLPFWIVYLILPLGFSLFSLRFIIGGLEDLNGLKTGDFSYLEEEEKK